MNKPVQWSFHGVLKDQDSDMSAYSAAGNLAQDGFLDGCRSIECPPNLIVSMPLRRTFPHNRLFIASKNAGKVIQLGYINLPLVKFITFSISSFLKGRMGRKMDFIIAYNPSFAGLLTGYIFETFTRKPYIPMIFDIIVPGKNTGNKLLASFNYFAYKKLLRRHKKVIVISKDIAKDFSLEPTALIIEGGLPEKTLRRFDTIAKSYSECGDKFDIVFAGGMESENGIFEMIEAMKLVKSTKVHLHIYGSGPLADRVKQISASLSNVDYHGYVEHSVVLERIKAADLLMNIRIDSRLSTKYFFPSKLIEYLSSGVPVLSTTFESLPPEYCDHLYLTPSEAPQDIATQIDRIVEIAETTRESMAQRAKEWVISAKSWESQAKKIISWSNSTAKGGK